MTDEQAIARYRYMLQTAPPETIEEAHREAFEKLTPEQRQMLLQQLSTQVPASERAAYGQNADDPRSLARLATRAEMRQPGTLERTYNSMPMMGGMSMGGLMAGSFFSTVAGVFVGSMIANQFFGDHGYNDGYAEGYNEGHEAGEADAGADGGYDQGAEADYAAQDMGGGYDTGSDGGVSSGDWGGGDFGGDFGGGDFGGGDFG
jgi:hypothetical protein